jgi:hypothetical protein
MVGALVRCVLRQKFSMIDPKQRGDGRRDGGGSAHALMAMHDEGPDLLAMEPVP